MGAETQIRASGRAYGGRVEDGFLSFIESTCAEVDWKTLTVLAKSVMDRLKGARQCVKYDVLEREDRVRYIICLAILSSRGIPDAACTRAYQFIAFLIHTGTYCTWTRLYSFYGVDEATYRDRVYSDPEFRWIEQFVDDVLTQIRVTDSKLIDERALLNLERSRWGGSKMQYTERAAIQQQVVSNIEHLRQKYLSPSSGTEEEFGTSGGSEESMWSN